MFNAKLLPLIEKELNQYKQQLRKQGLTLDEGLTFEYGLYVEDLYWGRSNYDVRTILVRCIKYLYNSEGANLGQALNDLAIIGAEYSNNSILRK